MGQSSIGVGVVVAMAAVGFGGARVSAAEVEPVALLWNAPAGCPTAEAVHDEVERNLAGPLKELGPVAAAVNVVEASQGHWRATLVLHSHGKRAERQFDAESCEALAAAAGLIVALAAEGVREDAPAAATAEAQPPPRRAEQTIVSNSSPAPAQPASGWRPSGSLVAVNAALDGGTMPRSPATGFEASAGQSWTTSLARLRLIGGVGFFLPETMLMIPATFGFPDGRYWMASFSGRACITATLSRFELGPCAGAELAVMRGTRIGQTTATSTQYWVSPLGSFVAAMSVASDVVVFARTDVVFPSTRRSFETDNNSEIYKVPALAVRGALGVELRFY